MIFTLWMVLNWIAFYVMAAFVVGTINWFTVTMTWSMEQRALMAGGFMLWSLVGGIIAAYQSDTFEDRMRERYRK